MSKYLQKVSIPELGEAMSQLLEEYNQEVVEGVDGAGMIAIQELVRVTRATAPVGFRGKYRKSIAWDEKYKETSKLTGRTYVWYVKPPDHRLTHLLVKGHATKDGGRTKANPFLHNAVEKVQQQYIEYVEDALKW